MLLSLKSNRFKYIKKAPIFRSHREIGAFYFYKYFTVSHETFHYFSECPSRINTAAPIAPIKTITAAIIDTPAIP